MHFSSHDSMMLYLSAMRPPGNDIDTCHSAGLHWPFHLMISCTLYVVVVDDGYFSVGGDDACTEEHQHHRCLLKDATNKPKKYGV